MRQGTVIFKASNTDWSQFNNVPENAKCAAEALYEHLTKPAGAALVTEKEGNGTIAISTIDYLPEDAAYVKFWQALLRQMGVKMGEVHVGLHQGSVSLDGGVGENNLLLNGPKN